MEYLASGDILALRRIAIVRRKGGRHNRVFCFTAVKRKM